MELVYPIYIDTPMMTSFLASLEGGLIEEATLEEKTSSAKERDRSGSGGAKISGLLSSVLSMEAKAEVSQKVSDSLESNYRSTVRFPEASLFIRLRELLRQEGMLQELKSKSFSDLTIGELVEFSGMVQPNPAYQIRLFIEQLSPLLESFTSLQNRQLESQIEVLNKAKASQSVFLGDQIVEFKDQNQINFKKNQLKLQLDSNKAQAEDMKNLANGIEKLMPRDHIEKLIVTSDKCKAICLVYPDFARDQRVQDIHYSQWSCIGKVIGKLEKDQTYDLFRGLPVGYFATNFLGGFMQGLSGHDINFELTDPQLEGPVFIVATLAIFS